MRVVARLGRRSPTSDDWSLRVRFGETVSEILVPARFREGEDELREIARRLEAEADGQVESEDQRLSWGGGAATVWAASQICQLSRRLKVRS